MMGPGLCCLLLSICIALSSFTAAQGKALAVVSRAQGQEDTGALARYRREALPYEGEMFVYPPAELGRNEAYYPLGAGEVGLARLGLALGRAGGGGGAGPEGADERLGQALQQLVEESRRRDQEATYLSGLLRAWAELGRPEAYPDYEEAAAVANGPPLPPRGRHASRDGGYGGGYGGGGARPADLAYGLVPPQSADSGERAGAGAKEAEEQVMRYLVGRILAGVDTGPDYPRPPRLVKRELLSLAAPAKRARRALDDQQEANLLRVKRLGGGEGGEAGVEELEEEEEQEDDRVPRPGAGLLRMKRIDGQFREPALPLRVRRYVGYPGAQLAQRVIKLLPD